MIAAGQRNTCVVLVFFNKETYLWQPVHLVNS